MNLLVAPIAHLISILSGGHGEFLVAEAYSSRRNEFSFFAIGTLISLGLIGGGIYFIIQGISGQLELETSIGTLKTDVVGLALVLIGCALYIAIGKILLRLDKEN